MRVLVAPDKFKGSCDAATVAQAIVAGLRDVWGERATYEMLPLADGGDGTVDAFIASGATPVNLRVANAAGARVDATYALLGDTAIVEMAAASGLRALAAPNDAATASSAGTGELLRDALDRGVRRIVLGIGGSATTDGGAGALVALGLRLLDAAGDALPPTCAGLAEVAFIDAGGLDPRLQQVDIEIACDVDNPLLGPRGAAAVYGPQKGVAAGDVGRFDAALAVFAERAVAAGGRDLRVMPGAGAAGGLGFGLATFTNATLLPGFAIVAEVLQLAQRLAQVTLCITGEGRIDEQTLAGKVVAGVAALAATAGVRVVAFGGSVDAIAERALGDHGVACLPIVAGPIALADAMRDAPALIRAAAARFARLAPLPI